ncbi:MAG: PEGA domain-containing protein [Pseudorhodoplanes sp.]|uniref:PEGA domain-containing protein n=1 Tax=Pseudorhodoplanes sp. TaxID=1934341 RepID=UPI003D126BD5
MLRNLAIVACGIALSACSSSGDLMRTATPTVPLQFESDPPGAEVKTSGGQTCRTPCALAVPAADFQVTYSLNGFQPQTIPVKLMPPEDMRGSGETGLTASQPRFTPSPVVAELVKAAPRRAPAKKPRVARQPPPAAAEPPPQRAEQQQPPPQQQQQRVQQQSQPPSTSGFNPPPPQSGGGFGAPPAPAPAGAWPAPAQTR